jgi:hypothetical protein
LFPDSTGLAYNVVFNSQTGVRACGEAGAAVALGGTASLGGIVNLTLEHDGTTASLTLSGPDGVWFGVGFGATAMKDAPCAAPTRAPIATIFPCPALSSCARRLVCVRSYSRARRPHRGVAFSTR